MRYINTNSKICKFSMKERRNEGMMQRRCAKKVTFFVSLKKGLYAVSDGIGKMTEYMLKMTVCKHCMTTDIYSVKKGMYINCDCMKYPTEYILKPTVFRFCLYVITNLLNVLIQASIDILYGMNIWTQTMNVCKSYIDNYNQITN